ncbi:hypothetical protein SDJN02_11362 [Cucurbita argyrosperma subsp. argyrosperma]|nr:hypothetical protein SDJN02_11362 [Cucurbita argyrosperma subsp. argyrosperma]
MVEPPITTTITPAIAENEQIYSPLSKSTSSGEHLQVPANKQNSPNSGSLQPLDTAALAEVPIESPPQILATSSSPEQNHPNSQNIHKPNTAPSAP